MTQWEKLEDGLVKFKFNRASKGNLGPSEARCVACDASGNILAIETKKLVDGKNNKAKTQATLLVVDMEVKLKVEHLYLEGDLEVIVNAIANDKAQIWKLDKIINIVHRNLDIFENFEISHIYIEGNTLVDSLSKMVMSFDNKFRSNLEIFGRRLI